MIPVSSPYNSISRSFHALVARVCALIALVMLVVTSYPLSADSELVDVQALPLLVAKVNADQQELESLLAEYVRWGGEVTHGQVLQAFEHFRHDGAQLGEHRHLSSDRTNYFLDLLGEPNPQTVDLIDSTDTSAEQTASNSARDVFAKTEHLLLWWEESALLALEHLAPKVSALKEGDAIAHHGIRRQLDLLGDNLLALQLAAFERQAQIERAHELRDQRQSRNVRRAYTALGIGTALVLSMLVLLLHLKVRAAGQLKGANDLLQVKVEEAHSLACKLEHNATHDQLTGLYNRHGFVAELEQAFADKDGTHSIVFIDLDGFKQVNDTAGHAAGDTLLQQIGVLLAAHAKPYGIASRFGGDEFVMLLPRCSVGTFRGVASSTCTLLSAMEFEAEGFRFPVAGSFGAVRFKPTDTTPTELMKIVDEACYESKSQGGGCVVFRSLAIEKATSDADTARSSRRAA